MYDSLFSMPTLLAAEAGAEHHAPVWGMFWMVGFVLLLAGLAIYLARQGLQGKVFRNPWTQWAEQLYLFLEQLAVGIIGSHGRKYLPMLATFWIFIFVSNIVGLFFDATPTADWSLNLGMAIIAVLYVQWEGIRSNGALGHLKHFAGPKMGGALVLVSGIIFIIEIISEAMKMLSLSLRLYGNIHGGHEVVVNLNNLGNFGEVALPVGGLLLPIKLLTAIVQAMIFVVLLSVYLSLVTHHDEEGHQHVPADEDHVTGTAVAHA